MLSAQCIPAYLFSEQTGHTAMAEHRVWEAPAPKAAFNSASENSCMECMEYIDFLNRTLLPGYVPSHPALITPRVTGNAAPPPCMPGSSNIMLMPIPMLYQPSWTAMPLLQGIAVERAVPPSPTPLAPPVSIPVTAPNTYHHGVWQDSNGRPIGSCALGPECLYASTMNPGHCVPRAPMGGGQHSFHQKQHTRYPWRYGESQDLVFPLGGINIKPPGCVHRQRGFAGCTCTSTASMSAPRASATTPAPGMLVVDSAGGGSNDLRGMSSTVQSQHAPDLDVAFPTRPPDF